MNYNNVAFEMAFGNAGQLPVSDLPEICFSGRSNVGKSSLINKLLGRKSLARVSTKPGKTITINFYRLDGFRLADLPGYGYAKISGKEIERFAGLMETYFRSDRSIKMVFQLVDMRHPPSKYDLDMLNFLSEMKLPYTVVLTKCDKLNKTERKQREEAFKTELSMVKNNIIIPFSSETGEGVEQLRTIIEGVLCE